jgi:predicted MFS family arabinose efflux permease
VVPLTIVITGLMAVGTIAQFVFGTLGPFLVAEFELSRAQLGTLTTVLFGVAALLSTVMGRATDRVRARLAYGAAFGLSAIALAGIAAAPGYLVLVLFAAVGGMGQALVNPLSNKLVAAHVPVRRRGLVMGIKQSGVQMGAVLAGFALPLLAVLIGWRTAVAAVAVAVLAGWVASGRVVPTGNDGREATAAKRSGGVNRVVAGLAVYAFLMGSGMAAVNAYLPLYAHEAVGLPAGVAGTLVAAIGVVGIASRILVGHLSDRIGDVGLLLNGMALIGAAALVLILLAQEVAAWLIWVGAFAFGWSVAWNAVAMIAVVRLAGPSATGQASGHVLTGFFAGFIVAPVAFGVAADAVGYTRPWLALVLLMVGISIAIWIWRRRSGRETEPAAAADD